MQPLQFWVLARGILVFHAKESPLTNTYSRLTMERSHHHTQSLRLTEGSDPVWLSASRCLGPCQPPHSSHLLHRLTSDMSIDVLDFQGHNEPSVRAIG